MWIGGMTPLSASLQSGQGQCRFSASCSAMSLAKKQDASVGRCSSTVKYCGVSGCYVVLLCDGLVVPRSGALCMQTHFCDLRILRRILVIILSAKR